jgi:hypothetical protein
LAAKSPAWRWPSSCGVVCFSVNPVIARSRRGALFVVWLVQPALLFSRNELATSNQSVYFSLGTNQHQPSATSQTKRTGLRISKTAEEGIVGGRRVYKYSFLGSF